MPARAVAAARARERELRKKELEQRRKATLKEVPVLVEHPVHLAPPMHGNATHTATLSDLACMAGLGSRHMSCRLLPLAVYAVSAVPSSLSSFMCMVLPQVRVGPKTAAADLAVKVKQARGFIEKGYRVKAAVPFRMSERAAAHDMLQRLRALGAEFAAVADPQVNERLARNTVAIYLSPL